LVQTSPDLADWQPLTTLTISNTAAQFIDVAVTNHSRRFYRAVLLYESFVPPSLQARLSGNNLIVTWPISEDGYALETSSSLTGTNSWAPVTNVPAIVDFQNTVTNQVSAGSRFYRLRKQ
jgi:hypothetical protein